MSQVTKIQPNKLLKITKPVRAIMLPSDATTTILCNHKHNHSLRISCTIPGKKRQVDASYRSVDLTTPPIIFSLRISEVPLREASSLIESYSIHGYMIDEGTVWAAPYRLPNTYEDGSICFGDFFPEDLRAAYNLFWSTPFNADLADCSYELIHALEKTGIDYEDTETYMKIYRKGIFSSQEWEDMTDKFLGDVCWKTSKSSHAILVTRSQELVAQIPEEHRLTNKGTIFIVASARRYKNVWSCNTGGFKFKLPRDMVNTRD